MTSKAAFSFGRAVAAALAVTLGCAALGARAALGPHAATASVAPSRMPTIAVANFNGQQSSAGSLETFPFTAHGDVAPATALTGPEIGDSNPQVIAIDRRGEVISRYSEGSSQPEGIAVFAPGATGNVAPMRVIYDPDSAHVMFGVGVDDAGFVYGEYLDDNKQVEGVDVFAPGADGKTKPVRTIRGRKTLLDQPLTIVQFFVGKAGDVWLRCDGEVGPPMIVGFAPGANGNVAPSRLLEPTPAGTQSFAADDAGRLYLTVDTSSGAFLDVYPSGSDSPSRRYQPDCEVTCSVAAVWGRYALFDWGPFPKPDGILVYEVTGPSGRITHLRAIRGRRTGIVNPMQIAVR